MRVLVADDDRLQRSLLETALSSWGYEVTCVENGMQAWELLQGESQFSLLITDWVMPELDGVSLCRKLRDEPRDPYLPVILLTSREGADHSVEALNSGADAFLTKPFSTSRLLAQIRVAERILDLEERLAEQVRKLRIANERLESGLVAAAAVQSSLLPDVSPKIHGVNFEWSYQACESLGGDMFNIFRLDERRIGMYVLDVSGHGPSAALQSVTLSHVLTPFDQQGGILKRISEASGRYEVTKPAEVARQLNRSFPLIERSGQFFTFLYGILDVETKLVRYVKAGHPGPIVVSRDGIRCLEKGGGIPLGILPDADYEEDRLQLSTGDSLVFYTDGVLETLSARREAFGLDRLIQTIGEADGGISERLRTLQLTLDAFGLGEPRRDDVTFVGLQIS
ncbi:MAG: fused response regulator/phosphatase [Deltaproteobacteria bacterium]|jgi:sigma-B regulation protein RsbU (phosphoserine phosphatase)|nr:fused response regulator/phosphatase [Deltaproteobacteria bacterium]